MKANEAVRQNVMCTDVESRQSVQYSSEDKDLDGVRLCVFVEGTEEKMKVETMTSMYACVRVCVCVCVCVEGTEEKMKAKTMTRQHVVRIEVSR